MGIGTPRGTRDAPDNFYQIERDAIKLRKRESELEEVVRELKEENERFKSERRTLFDGEKKERLTGQEREKGWSTERVILLSLCRVTLSLTKDSYRCTKV